jgi:hypothetical protein
LDEFSVCPPDVRVVHLGNRVPDPYVSLLCRFTVFHAGDIDWIVATNIESIPLLSTRHSHSYLAGARFLSGC